MNASLELRGDREIVMKAVSQTEDAFEYASQQLKGDRKFVIEMVLEQPMALQHATEELRGDQEVVMKAVAKDGMALEYASVELRGDREVVMKAICQNGLSVLYATEDMKGDEEVMQAALAAQPAYLVGLRVFLLSGRSCSQVFFRMGGVAPRLSLVRRKCAQLLDLDLDVVEQHGSLMLGEMQITNIYSLTPGKVHELALVLS